MWNRTKSIKTVQSLGRYFMWQQVPGLSLHCMTTCTIKLLFTTCLCYRKYWLSHKTHHIYAHMSWKMTTAVNSNSSFSEFTFKITCSICTHTHIHVHNTLANAHFPKDIVFLLYKVVAGVRLFTGHTAPVVQVQYQLGKQSYANTVVAQLCLW